MIGHTPDLKLQGALLLDGAPVDCTGCGSSALWLERCGSRETWPARMGCYSCGRSDDHPVITNGLVEAAVLARTGRSTAADRDTFAAEWRGITLVGEVVPEFVLDDARVLVDQLRTEGRKRGRAWWKSTRKAAAGQAGRAGGSVKSRVLGAAWQVQTGGAGPVRRKARRCSVKGCKRGMVTIRTKLHSPTGKARKVEVPCGVCHRSA